MMTNVRTHSTKLSITSNWASRPLKVVIGVADLHRNDLRWHLLGTLRREECKLKREEADPTAEPEDQIHLPQRERQRRCGTALRLTTVNASAGSPDLTGSEVAKTLR
jgi:hypothetical protein